jgi:Ca2+-binding EF-hand superfamily protein
LATLDASLTRSQLQDIWKAIDPKGQGQIAIDELHKLLGGRYGKDKATAAAQNSGVIERVIHKILERCGEKAGVKGLAR